MSQNWSSAIIEGSFGGSWPPTIDPRSTTVSCCGGQLRVDGPLCTVGTSGSRRTIMSALASYLFCDIGLYEGGSRKYLDVYVTKG